MTKSNDWDEKEKRSAEVMSKHRVGLTVAGILFASTFVIYLVVEFTTSRCHEWGCVP